MQNSYNDSGKGDQIEERPANDVKVSCNAFKFDLSFRNLTGDSENVPFHTIVVMNPVVVNLLLEKLEQEIKRYIKHFGPIEAEGENIIQSKKRNTTEKNSTEPINLTMNLLVGGSSNVGIKKL